MSHEQVVKNYGQRKVNKRTGDVDWKGSRIFSDGNVLYSYGRHFPLAVYLGERKREHFFLKNGDKYSSSTSGHQSLTQSACPGPTVSRNALEAANIPFHRLTLDNILFWRPDFREHVYRDKETGKYYKEFHGKRWNAEGNPDSSDPWFTGALEAELAEDEWKAPKQGMFIAYSRSDERFVSGVWHILGAVALEWQGRHYLSSLDESSYFVSELPRKPRNMEDAFESLKPPQVRKAIKAGVDVKRQGEWFFVPLDVTDEQLAKQTGLLNKGFLRHLVRKDALPFREGANRHVVDRLYKHNGELYTQGRVFHRFPPFGREEDPNKGTLTGQHRTLKLGDVWHRAYRNLELNSWSMHGRFD